MPSFTVRTAEQLPKILQGFRKDAGLTQGEAAMRLGVTQQTYSSFERNAEKLSAARLMRLLALLEVELVLKKEEQPASASSAGNPQW